MTIMCDNHTSSYISSNIIFHELIKHIDIDYHQKIV